MKRLTLIRHARASHGDSQVSDFDRALTDQGAQEAALMGFHLVKQRMHPDHVISSPAKRALSSAIIIADTVGFLAQHIATDKQIYDATVDALMHVVHGIANGYSNVLLIGHNPGLLEVCQYLTGKQLDKLPTAGVVSLEFNVSSWADIKQGKGKIVFVDYPGAGDE